MDGKPRSEAVEMDPIAALGLWPCANGATACCRE